MKRILLTGKAGCFVLLHSVFLSAQQPYDLPEDINRLKNQISIGIKPQVELMSIIQTIGKYSSIFEFLMSQDPSDYKTDVITHFTPYKDHPAVGMLDRLCARPRMLNFSAPSNIMLYTDSHLHLREDIELDSFVISRAGGMDSLEVFLGLLRDFAVTSSFNEFYNMHQAYYRKVIDITMNNTGSIPYIAELGNFYGVTQRSYHIVLVSLYSFVGYGNSLLHRNGQYELFTTLGPKTVEENIPFFGDVTRLKYLIRHEFSHPFINPLTEKYWDYIKAYSYLYDAIPEKARQQVCGDWQECINELVIRAITTHLAFNESDEAGTWAYNQEISSGVPGDYLDSLLKKIQYYQLDRDRYPAFESFYTEILEVFKGDYGIE